MSLTISIRFLTGRAHLHPWQTHHSEGRVEWPPSPWRLLRTFVAVAGRGLTSLPYQGHPLRPPTKVTVLVPRWDFVSITARDSSAHLASVVADGSTNFGVALECCKSRSANQNRLGHLPSAANATSESAYLFQRECCCNNSMTA